MATRKIGPDPEEMLLATGLLNSAWVWDQYWFKRTNMPEIAELAGISVGTLYKRFKEWGFPTRKRGSNPSTVHAVVLDDTIREIKETVGAKKKSQAAWSRELGVSRQRISQLFHGDHRVLADEGVHG